MKRMLLLCVAILLLLTSIPFVGWLMNTGRMDGLYFFPVAVMISITYTALVFWARACGPVACVALLLMASPASAQCRRVNYGYAAPVYGTPTYSVPTYKAPTYVAPTYDYKEVVFYPKVVALYNPVDSYASTRDYYRDQLLADAIAYRILSNQRGGEQQGGNPGPAPAASVPQQGQPRQMPRVPEQAGFRTPVNPKLSEYVAANCVRCHGTGKNTDLTDLAAVPVGKRWHAHGLVNNGRMPKDAEKPAPDEIVVLFNEWAESGSRGVARQP